MSSLEDEIKRKIKIRKFAMDNLGTKTDTDSTVKAVASDSETNKLFQELYENIQSADQSRIQDGYSNIATNRKLGKLIIFVKRVVRKLINVFLGWYIRPILDKQTFFNGKTINSIDLLRQLLLIQQQHYEQKLQEMEQVRDTNWNLIKELEQKTKELENIKIKI